MKKKEVKKALFSQRVFAFLLDIIIVSMISSLIIMFIPVSDATEKLYDEQEAILENYVSDQENMEEVINQFVDIGYDISRETGAINIISVVIALCYFVIYPFYHDGQTIGKNLLKIKIVKSNNSDLTMNDLLFRAMINNSILANILNICLVFFTSKDFYLSSSTIISFIQYLIMIASTFMIAFAIKRQGIHDKIAHTDVVCVLPIKEEVKEICEN